MTANSPSPAVTRASVAAPERLSRPGHLVVSLPLHNDGIAALVRPGVRLDLIASQRTAGNQRRYPRYMLRRVALISVAKRLGIPLDDVKTAFADVPLTTAPTHADWQRASRTWRKALEARRRGIEQLEQELTGCIGCGCLSMKACALLNPDDALGGEGAGARRLPV